MSRIKEIIAFVNNKGGVAKTTTTLNVAAAMRRLDDSLRILCIDMDSQCNLSATMGWNEYCQEHAGEPQPTIADALRSAGSLPVYKREENWYYVPASDMLDNVKADLDKQMQPKQVLLDCLQSEIDDHSGDSLQWVEDEFDYVLIDCPPSLNDIALNAMSSASGIVIPVELSGYSVNGIAKVVEKFKMVHDKLNKDLKIRGLLITKTDERTSLTRGLRGLLRQNFESLVFETSIRLCTKMKEAEQNYQSIYEYAPDCTAAMDYLAFTKEFLQTSE